VIGTVTFSGLSITAADPGYALHAVRSGLTSATTSAVTAGKSSQFGTTLEPGKKKRTQLFDFFRNSLISCFIS
jgi:hypothetical protein